jgi:hypothetical protein
LLAVLVEALIQVVPLVVVVEQALFVIVILSQLEWEITLFKLVVEVLLVMQKAVQELHHSLLILEFHQLLLLVAAAVVVVEPVEPLPEMVALVVLEVGLLRVDLLLERDLVILVELPIQILLQMVGVMMVDLGDLTVQEAVAAQVVLEQTEIHQTFGAVMAVMDYPILLMEHQ